VNCSFDSNYGASAVYVVAGKGSFSNCTFDNNSNDNNNNNAGGAVYSSSGYWQFTNCRFSTNTANTGGAVYKSAGYPISFVDCSFVGNTAAQGGALVLSSSGSGSVTNCTFDGNKATSGSGGAVVLSVVLFGGTTTPFVDCTFINNIATAQGGHGGALFASANTLGTVAGCHFVASALTTKGNNDIARNSTTTPRGLVEFICPVNSTGASVMMKPDDLLVTQLPPQQQIVHCTP
jgi:hypothetical protein